MDATAWAFLVVGVLGVVVLLVSLDVRSEASNVAQGLQLSGDLTGLDGPIQIVELQREDHGGRG